MTEKTVINGDIEANGMTINPWHVSVDNESKQLKCDNDEDEGVNITTSTNGEINVFKSDMANDTDLKVLTFGKNSSDYNCGHIKYHHGSDGNTGNYIAIEPIDHTGSLNITRNVLYFNAAGNGGTIAQIFQQNASGGKTMAMSFGHRGANNQCATFTYYHAWTTANKLFGIGFYGKDNIFTIKQDNLVRVNGNTNAAPLRIFGTNNPAIALGREATTNNCITLKYHHDTTPHFLGLGFWGADDILTIDTDKNVNIDGPLTTTGDITANGVNINSTLASKADNTVYIEDDMNTDDFTFQIGENNDEVDIVFNTTLINVGTLKTQFDFDTLGANEVIFTIDYANKTVSSDSSVITSTFVDDHIHCQLSTGQTVTQAPSFLETTLKCLRPESLNAAVQNILNNSTQTSVDLDDLQIQSDIDDLEYRMDNHKHTTAQITDLDALKIEIFKMIYPVGSIYQSFTPINNHSLNYTDSNERVIVEWNECSWELLDSGTFVRCVEHVETKSGSKYNHEIEGSGETGGEAEHTLTIEEMPSHNHIFTGNNATGSFDVRHMENYNTSTVGNGSGVFTATTQASSVSWANGIVQKSSNKPNDQVNFSMTPTGSISNTGGGQAHNNLPPYITAYVYKRIA